MTRKPKPAPAAPVSVSEAARQIGVHRDTAYRLIKAGLLGCIDAPGTGGRRMYRVPQEAIDQYKTDHYRAATA